MNRSTSPRARRISRLALAARQVTELLEPRRLLIAVASDQTVTGTIATPTSTVDYEITLAVGDSLLAAVGETSTSTFDPAITVLRPDNSVATSDFSELGTLVTVNNVTQAGTWKVRVSDGGTNDTGAYRLTVVAVDATQAPNDGDGGAITSGQRKDGTIVFGDLDVNTVAATAGDKLIVSGTWLSGDANFQPALYMYGPTGTFIDSDGSPLGTELDVSVGTTGTYYIVTSDLVNYSAGDRNLGAGTYRLRVVKAPATQAQDDADGGAITAGQRKDGTIDLGDLDVYTATLSAGDSVMATVAERNGNNPFDPLLRIYGPTGTLITNDGSTLGTELDFTASSAGTYYFVVSDGVNYSAGDRGRAAGDYSFRMVKVPATQGQDDTDGGAVSSGQKKDGTIDLGDLDAYTASISAGDSIIATVAETNGDHPFNPRLRIFGPTGALIPNADDSSTLGTELVFTAATSGTYYFVVSDDVNYSAGDRAMATGTYAFRYTKAPGTQVQDDADGGAITNGQRIFGTIDLGDIDTYTIGAVAGDKLLVSAVERRGNRAIDPRMRIYGPTGAVLFDDASTLGTEAALNITTTGNYYIAITDNVNYSAGDRAMATGEYTLRAIRAPLVPTNDDADGGPITSGERKLGTLDRGDFDVYSFAADTGDDLLVNVHSIVGVGADAYVRVYSPAGVLIANTDGSGNFIDGLFPLTVTGTYIAVVSDSLNFSAGDRNFETGDYAISLALTPATQVTDADSGQLISGQSRAGALSIGDIDVYTFNATAGVPFTLNLLDTAAGAFDPALSLFGPTGATLFNSSDPTSRTFTIANPPTGTYTAFVYDANGDESGAYSIALNTPAGGDTFAPSVLRANYRYNDPLPQLRVEFSEPVAPSFSIDDFVLKNLTTNTTLDNFSLTTTFEANRDNFVVTFDSFDGRVLPDGNYRLSIAAGNIRDAANNPMTSDFTYDFFVLAGDVNHDRAVNFDDLVILAQNYSGLDRTYAEGNINYSSQGEVDFDDLVVLAQKYNSTLPALAAVTLNDAVKKRGGGKTKPSLVDGIVD